MQQTYAEMTESQTDSCDFGSETAKCSPLKFHAVHGDSIQLSADKRRASRIDSISKGICFSNRAIVINERVCIKIKKVSTKWDGGVSFGFTSYNPATINIADLPVVWLSLTDRPGYWARMMELKTAEKDAVSAFYVTRGGDVMNSENGEENDLFLSGVTTSSPVWMLLDIYRKNTSVEFVDTSNDPAYGGNSFGVSAVMTSQLESDDGKTCSGSITRLAPTVESDARSVKASTKGGFNVSSQLGTSKETKYSECIPTVEQQLDMSEGNNCGGSIDGATPVVPTPVDTSNGTSYGESYRAAAQAVPTKIGVFKVGATPQITAQVDKPKATQTRRFCFVSQKDTSTETASCDLNIPTTSFRFSIGASANVGSQPHKSPVLASKRYRSKTASRQKAARRAHIRSNKRDSIKGTTLKFVPPFGTMLIGGVTRTVDTRHQCITDMEVYARQSLEELRLQDYIDNRNGTKQSSTLTFEQLKTNTGIGLGQSSKRVSIDDDNNGTAMKFAPPTGEETMLIAGAQSTVSTRHQCITAMEVYTRLSLEELRLQDYIDNRNGTNQSSTLTFEQLKKTTGICLGQSNKTVSIEASTELPSSWSPMGSTEHVKLEELHCDSHEYQLVKGTCMCTANGTVNEITKIERVQNPCLYRQYLVLKKEMMRHSDDPKFVERRFWHGTTAEAVDSINAHGFNRSFGGKNGHAYGKGVYFARKSSCSIDNVYSTLDAGRLKRIYLALVLTGEYTRGSNSFIVPPDNPEKSGLPFDSVVDSVITPEVFVIFKDAIAYPEYLITFQ